MTLDDARFAADVAGFAGHFATSLSAFRDLPGRVETTSTDRGALVELVPSDDEAPRRWVAVTVGGAPAAGIAARVGLRRDSSGRYLAVTFSSFALYALVDREPLFRLEYRDDMTTAPSCHWQVHAERGALSHVLTLAGANKPHTLSAVPCRLAERACGPASRTSCSSPSKSAGSTQHRAIASCSGMAAKSGAGAR